MRFGLPLLALSLLAGCRETPPPQTRTFDGPAALRNIERQLAFGPRIPGTDGHRRTANWIDSMVRARTDSVIVQRWNHVTASGDTLPMVNLIARFNPAAEKRLLYFAHWDTRPRADAPTSSDSTKPVPGANDGGSGVAILLGVADALRARPLPASLGVDLLFVDGEDYGDFKKTPKDVLIGSRHYTANPAPGPRPIYAVLFDMVGDKDLQVHQEGYSVMGAPEVVDVVWDVARQLGHGDVFIPRPKHTLTDDHVELQKAGYRAIDVVDFDYPAWHTPDDTIDKVSAESLGLVGRIALALIQREEI